MADLVVVDDDADTAEFLSLVLTMHGHRVRIAHDGEAGLRLLRERLPDVLLVDVQLPMLDGAEVVRRIAAESLGAGRLVIVVMSARDDLPDVALRIGTPHVLAKPCTESTVIVAVERALASVLVDGPGSSGAGRGP
jgi:DNA-binding response OmpR family regulator